MTIEAQEQDKSDVWTCENCGRDFESETIPIGSDGVVWCPECEPAY